MVKDRENATVPKKQKLDNQVNLPANNRQMHQISMIPFMGFQKEVKTFKCRSMKNTQMTNQKPYQVTGSCQTLYQKAFQPTQISRCLLTKQKVNKCLFFNLHTCVSIGVSRISLSFPHNNRQKKISFTKDLSLAYLSSLLENNRHFVFPKFLSISLILLCKGREPKTLHVTVEKKEMQIFLMFLYKEIVFAFQLQLLFLVPCLSEKWHLFCII